MKDLFLISQPEIKETQLPIPFGLNFNWKTEAERFQKQLAGIQADVKGFETRIGQLEAKMDNVQTGMLNSANSGSQILAGDVGIVSVIGIFLLILTGIIGYYKTKITLHKKSNVILASATNDEEARELAANATPQVQAVVKEAIDEKNKVQNG